MCKKRMKNELYIKILILIILILMVIVTSFRTGRKFYLIMNTYFDNTTGEVKSNVAKWNFNVKIIIGNEVIYGKKNN